MASTKAHSPVVSVIDWRAKGKRYYAYNDFLRARFGERVHKVSLDGGFTCPNVDGTVGVGGCTFCNNWSFSPSRRLPTKGDIQDQLAQGMRRVHERYGVTKFIGYFQPATNTYAPVERLRELFESALSHPQVVGLAVSTRPDCLPDDVIELLAELGRSTFVSVELGMQTIHDRSLEWMNRGHDHRSFLDAVDRLRDKPVEIAAHVILGLPGETHDDMLATSQELARLNLDAVKLHNLYVVKNTELAKKYQGGDVRLLELDEFARVIVDTLEILPPATRIDRIGGEAPPKYFVAPKWAQDKIRVRTAVMNELERRDTWQGKLYGEPS